MYCHQRKDEVKTEVINQQTTLIDSEEIYNYVMYTNSMLSTLEVF